MLRVDTIAFFDTSVNVSLSGPDHSGTHVETGDTIAFLYDFERSTKSDSGRERK